MILTTEENNSEKKITNYGASLVFDAKRIAAYKISFPMSIVNFIIFKSLI